MYILKYLIYVLEHKINVVKTAWKRKLYLHAFTHDLSKFSGSEFFSYARYFYKDKEKYKLDFEMAWRHHYRNNPHHWQHWLDKEGSPMEIPAKYIQQILADWEAMSLKFGGTAQKYYLDNYNKIKLTNNTRISIEFGLGLNYSIAHNYGHTLKEFYKMYGSNDLFLKSYSWIEKKYGVDLKEILKD